MSILSGWNRVFAGIALAFAVSLQVLLVYWAFFPVTPLVIEKIEIVGTPKAGEMFTYKMLYRKNVDVPETICKQFVDGFVVALPLSITNMPIGRRESVHSVFLPKIPPGDYYFKLAATYQVNPIKEVTVQAQTSKFRID